MLKIKLIENDGEMEIREYSLSHPFNLVSENNDKTYYSVNSIEYKNIKGSFRIFFCKKIDFSGFRFNGDRKIIKNATITDVKDSRINIDPNAKQLILFKQKLLFYFDEKKSSLIKSEKKNLPHFLLINEEEAKKSIQFFIVYDESNSEKKINKEEIILYLNLFYDE